MARPDTRNYFVYIFFTLLFSVSYFLFFKKVLPERLFPDTQIQGPNIAIDSLALVAMNADTIQNATADSSYMALNDSASTRYEFSLDENMEGHSYISSFYDKLYALENSKEKNQSIRIAYFGDSMTDADYIVQDMRRLFQQKYGGQGVGFVGITSQSAQSRYSVSHKYSKNWNTKSFLKKHIKGTLLGIDGQVSFAESGSVTIEYKANGWANCEQLNNPTLFFGKSTNDSAYVSIYLSKDSLSKINLAPTSLLNTAQLGNTTKKLKLGFHHADSIPFYGVDFSSKQGVHVDNFSMRGNSGLPLSLLNVGLMNSFDEKLHYDLIILQYGANILSYGTTDYSWYEKQMSLVVMHLRKCFPHADIIIVSVADKASKVDMEMKTDKAVVPLMKAQKYCAERTGAGFINLYNLMGGENSMVKWVDEKPTLATKDYTHFNISGSKKIAGLIFTEIENGYENHKKRMDE